MKIIQLENEAEEADPRLLFHAKQASEAGATDIVLRTSDTDVIVLALHHQRDIDATIYVQRQASKKRWKLIHIFSLSQDTF